jgi:hypothetical protein
VGEKGDYRVLVRACDFPSHIFCALNLELSPPAFPKSLWGPTSSAGLLSEGDFVSFSLVFPLNFGRLVSLINGIVKLPG